MVNVPNELHSWTRKRITDRSDGDFEVGLVISVFGMYLSRFFTNAVHV